MNTMKIKTNFLIKFYFFALITELSLTEDTKTSVTNFEDEKSIKNFQIEIKSINLTDEQSKEIDKNQIIKETEDKRKAVIKNQKNYKKDEQQNIIGGFQAKLGWYPYQVALFTARWSGISFYCGGSIISNYYVLTAAHCTVRRVKIKIVGGIVSIKNFGRMAQVRYSRYIITHEKYNHGESAHDISLMLVKEQFHFNKYVKPVKLPTKPMDLHSQCIVSGWGSTKPEHTIISETLKAVHVFIREGKKCKNMYRHFMNGMICSGFVKGRDFCFGDSGGPLVCDNEQHGVVSFFVTETGDLCGEGGPQIHTKVFHYKPWIDYQMRQNMYRKDSVSTATTRLHSNSIHLIRLSIITAFTIFYFYTLK